MAYNKDMNTGKVLPKIHFNAFNNTENYIYYSKIQKAWSFYHGFQKWPDRRTNYVKARDDAEQAMAAYDNSGFLLLSITALVSSGIIAIVTSRGKHREPIFSLFLWRV